jgi:hypothetical protein
MRFNRLVCVGALALAAWGAGCSKDGARLEPVGSVQVAVTNVPADGSVGCIRIITTGTFSTTQSFDVTPGESTVFGLTGVEVGTERFDGAAFPGACSSVTASSTPTWVGPPVFATVVVGQTVSVTIDLFQAGSVDAGVSFNPPSCRPSGDPCLQPAECCSGLCGPDHACATCSAAADCPATSSPCVLAACTGGACGTTFVAAGTVTAVSGGGCAQIVCDGSGGAVSEDAAAGAPCDDGAGGHLCDGGGHCLACLPDGLSCAQASDCCGGSCNQGICEPTQPMCRPDGQACAQFSDCCSGGCDQGICGPPGCAPASICNGQCCLFGSVCQGGACVCPGAQPGLCGGSCTDMATDLLNCGACGTACPPNVACVAGACVCPPAQLCGGVCSDTSSDPNNCGACGVACGSSAVCVGSACHPVVAIDTNTDSFAFGCSMVADGANVYWASTTGGIELRQVARSGGPGTLLAALNSSQSFGGIADDATFVYWATDAAGTILRSPKSPPSTPTPFVQGLVAPIRPVIAGTTLYWLDSQGLLSVPTTPGGVPSLITPNIANQGPLAADAAQVYYSTGSSLVAQSTSTQARVTLANPGPDTIVVDGATVYYSVAGGSISSVSNAGGASTTVATNAFGPFAIDTANVYFLSTGSPMRVVMVPKSGGSAVTLSQVQNPPFAFIGPFTNRCIAADDTYVYWVDSGSVMRYTK